MGHRFLGLRGRGRVGNIKVLQKSWSRVHKGDRKGLRKR